MPSLGRRGVANRAVVRWTSSVISLLYSISDPPFMLGRDTQTCGHQQDAWPISREFFLAWRLRWWCWSLVCEVAKLFLVVFQ